MEVGQIIAELDSEIERLKQVRNLLAGGGISGGGGKKAKRGRPAGKPAKKKRVLSAKARKAISDAQKKRWAKQKAAAK